MNLSSGSTLKSSAYIINRHVRTTECADIYIAQNSISGHHVLIHRLLDNYGGYSDLFMEKADVISRLTHPSIAEVTDIFPDGDSACYVSKLHEGTSISSLTSQAPLTPERAVAIVRDVANALSVFHVRGLPNLAVSPDNIIIDCHTGTPLIATFSLPLPLFMDEAQRDPYSAPERYSATGRNNSSHDIYSLGALLYHCLTGKTPPSPEPSTDPATTFAGIPPHLANIIRKAMSPQMFDRYFSAGEFVEALDNAQLSGASESAPVTTAEPVIIPEPIPEPVPEPADSDVDVDVPEPEVIPEPEPDQAEAAQEETAQQEAQPTEPTPVSKVEEEDEESASGNKKRMVIAIAGILLLGIIIGMVYTLITSTYAEKAPVTGGVIHDGADSASVSDKQISVGPTQFTYTGEVNAEGMPQGEGSATYTGQWSSYEGNWENGQWNGHGTLTYSNGDYFEGEFANNFFTTGKYVIDPKGKGKDAGSYFEGEFRNGAPFNGAWKDKSGKSFQTITEGKTI